jgi:hypothetical protein
MAEVGGKGKRKSGQESTFSGGRFLDDEGQLTGDGGTAA